MRIEMDLMKQFFKPTFEKIQHHIQAVLTEPDIGNITHLFLVGGFAESPLLQVKFHKLLSKVQKYQIINIFRIISEPYSVMRSLLSSLRVLVSLFSREQ